MTHELIKMVKFACGSLMTHSLTILSHCIKKGMQSRNAKYVSHTWKPFEVYIESYIYPNLELQ